jgi:hypothetical protein
MVDEIMPSRIDLAYLIVTSELLFLPCPSPPRRLFDFSIILMEPGDVLSWA